MQAANFTLDSIYYPETIIKANINFDRSHVGDEPNGPQVRFYVHSNDETSLTIALKVVVQCTSIADPYEVEVTAIGKFSAAQDSEKKASFAQILASAPNILYGAAREHILNVTARSAWNELILGPVVFDPDDFQSSGDAE
jgi:preprotein translocase subunit SecB